jgi:PAS domain-containing protein
MDGVRKKAKYLHDAPDGALMPGIGGHYAQVNGTHAVSLPGQDPGAVSVPQQAGFYTQAPTGNFYAPTGGPGQVPASVQEVPQFNNPQAPISPPYSQNTQGPMSSVPSTAPHGAPAQIQQWFDPSDPALFNFDISSLNFGNHYGALEMGMLGHMSSGAAETPPSDNNLMNPLNQAAGMYNQQVPYGDNPGMATTIAYGPDGLPAAEWQNAPSRQGSIQMQTPNNTPITASLDHSHRQDSLHGPHAFAIGQGPSSISSASPASTDVNPPYDTDTTMGAGPFFPGAGQQQVHQRPPHVSRMHGENRPPSNALQPIPPNVMRKRRRDTKWIYTDITKPFNYVASFHHLFRIIERRYSASSVKKVRSSFASFRPALMTSAAEMDQEDLIHQEQALQRSLIQLEEFFSEVGTPSLIFRRTGEVVWMNKEFSILTGWQREVLLGKEPNMNVNVGQVHSNDSGASTRNSTTPVMAGQEPGSVRNPVNITELMDERSAVEFFDDFAETAYLNSRGAPCRRVMMLRYWTKEDVARNEELKTNTTNGKPSKQEPLIKLEGGPVHRGEAAMSRLGAKDGLVDCMVQWNVKRDNVDMPMLVCMHVSNTAIVNVIVKADQIDTGNASSRLASSG